MTSRKRNLSILALVVVLLIGAGVLIQSKETRLGLDLQGGIELIYQAQPTPKVPEITPQALDDSIETIRKRTDALGVSEPEIQRSGSDQISIGLPDVQDPQRALEQVGSTAQLQFYDFEPNLFVENEAGKVQPLTEASGGSHEAAEALSAPIPKLWDAVQIAKQAKPSAEATDLPPGGPNEAELRREGVNPEDRAEVRRYYDGKNDTRGESAFYLFGPNERPLGPDGRTTGASVDENIAPAANCEEALSVFDRRAEEGSREPVEVPKGSECREELGKLGSNGPPEGSRIVEVPRGIVIVKAERPEGLRAGAPFNRYFVLEDDFELSGNEVKNPQQGYDQANQPIVTMEFTDRGRPAFERLTKRVAERGAAQSAFIEPGEPRDVANQRFAITLDNEVISNATIDFEELPEGIDGKTGAQIEGLGGLQPAQDLAESLRIGALPVDLKLISQTQVSATLGKQALNQGLLAGGAGLGLTILFLLVFYRVLGLVATAALVIYAVFLFALVKLIPITLTLPGIAGMILTLGVAADANIVMYERIKEEARAGKSIPAAISGGYAKALRTIIDANVVTIGVAFILFTLATAGVKGFAFTLGIGTIVSLFTAVLATSAILGSMARSRVLRRPSALGAGRQRISTRIDFMGKSKWFFSGSGVILVIGALAIAGLGLKFGIDFESGTRITAPLDRPASVQQVRDTIEPLGFGDARVQGVDDPELGQNVVQIAVGELEPKDRRVEEALDERFGLDADQVNRTSVGPTFGEQIASTAIIAVIASLILIALYIGFRFEFKYSVPVLIALVHDLLITAGVYALAERDVTTATVAALLTIMGYSLYDTIIVFDRIRENVPRMPRATFSQIANRSMSEVLTRSLATSFSTLAPITALLLFGGETLKDFAFALLVGVASGAYSSIFIATPVLVEWKEREPIYMRRRKIVLEEHGGMVPAFADGTIPAADAKPAAAAAPAAQRPAEAPAPERPPPEPVAPVGDGDGDGDGAPPPVAGTAAGGTTRAERQARKASRQRKKHGRR